MEKMKSIVECVYAIFTKTCRGAFWYRTSQIRVLMQLRKPIPRLDVKGWMVEWVAILVNTDTVEVLTLFDINKTIKMIPYIFEKYTSYKLKRVIITYVHLYSCISHLMDIFLSLIIVKKEPSNKHWSDCIIESQMYKLFFFFWAK